MHFRFLRLSSLLLIALIVSACRKQAFEDFYGKPDNLAPPIYAQLEKNGTFSILLKVIDRSGYKNTLSAAGSWTFFAADDAAFQKYFQDNGITGVDKLTDAQCEAIVRYSMIYDGEKTARLNDFFSSKGFVENAAFRRRTVYYDFVYDGKNATGQDIKAIASNRNGGAAYVSGDFNNKYIPIFLEPYVNAHGITAADYQALYPGRTYTGFNIGPASVSAANRDIVAENGVIHFIDYVLAPPPSIDQYISSNNDYSEFRNLLNKFASYTLNSDMSQKYTVLSGKTANVYVKSYPTLPIAPNNENYMKVDANDGQTDCFSAVIPNNAAVSKFAKEVLLKYYPKGTTLDQLAILRPDIVQTFVSSHFLGTALWPSKFNSVPNNLGENITVPAGNAVEKKFLSNGIFYGTSSAHVAYAFSSVYSKVYLDPKFTIMRAALDRYGFSDKIKNPSLKYMLIPVSDEILKKAGFSYDPLGFPNNPIRYNGASDELLLKRIVGTHVIDLNNRQTIPNISSGEGFLLTAINEPDNFEYVRYKDGRLFSSGTIDSSYTAIDGLVAGPGSPSIATDSLSSGINGPVAYSRGILRPTDNNVGLSIERNGTKTTDPYYGFFQYLKNSTAMYNATTRVITGVDLGLSYTIFIPTNAQINQAVRDGLLPGTFNATTVTPNYNPTDDDQKNQVERFIRYHILNKVTIVADGHLLRKGVRETLLKNGLGDVLLLNITENTATSLKVTDGFGRVASVINPTSSLLSNRVVIHQIDTYLKFSY